MPQEILVKRLDGKFEERLDDRWFAEYFEDPHTGLFRAASPNRDTKRDIFAKIQIHTAFLAYFLPDRVFFLRSEVFLQVLQQYKRARLQRIFFVRVKITPVAPRAVGVCGVDQHLPTCARRFAR